MDDNALDELDRLLDIEYGGDGVIERISIENIVDNFNKHHDMEGANKEEQSTAKKNQPPRNIEAIPDGDAMVIGASLLSLSVQYV